ncbi:MAG: tRNA preQ1(34) S-adenosylmethionine ribosyltransferase-isomerase QueA [Deltaproteobacteria bacterium]|nr:tRNA preQ1(34) S-adenosylmethionine ribosyltransferase-isomerase QueA [Deltaproteobacteria bacterium]
MRTDALDYELPDALIAQRPTEARDGARMLVLAGGALHDSAVLKLAQELPPSLIVLNDTRVLPARLLGTKPTGGRAELFLLERLSKPGSAERWRAIGRASKGLKAGHQLGFGEGALSARVLEREPGGDLEVELLSRDGAVGEALERLGKVPLPPYIRRDADAADRERYQTVFAKREGAVAAPTAGLHLSKALLASLEEAGHRFAYVTLHVGLGTFAPVKSHDLDDHPMHEEAFEIPEATVIAIHEARTEGRPVLAVGTTVVRALESAADEAGALRAGAARTRLLIQPGYEFRVVDSLLTNFHLPCSTLLALVMAFAGEDVTRRAYAHAVEARYRFFSYGDAMLIPRRA